MISDESELYARRTVMQSYAEKEKRDNKFYESSATEMEQLVQELIKIGMLNSGAVKMDNSTEHREDYTFLYVFVLLVAIIMGGIMFVASVTANF